MIKSIFKKSNFLKSYEDYCYFLKIKSYDFFTQYDSSSYSAYKSIKIKLSKINH